MKIIFTKPYLFWLIIIFVFYIALAVILSKFYINFKYIIYYLTTINWTYFLISIIFTLIIGFLVALNLVYSYIKYKQHKEFKKETAVTCFGTIGGLSTGVCPVCVSGLFPFLLGTFGISFTYAILPFKGLEIQFLVILVLVTNLYFLHRRSQ